MKVEGKSNEITAIPVLLKLFDLSGCIVTIDAMGCQREIAQVITEAGADYVLALKGNQGTMHQDVITMVHEGLATQFKFKEIAHHTQQTVDKGHGRIERRRYWLVDDEAYLGYLNSEGKWANLRSIGVVQAEREVNGSKSSETRYYLCSLSSLSEFMQAACGHWDIENGLHWVLDIVFREDLNRTRTDHSAHNLAIIRHIALNLLKAEKTAKVGVKVKRLKCGWNEDYLLKVLLGPQPI